MGPVDQLPTNDHDAESTEKDFTSVCCHDEETPHDCLIECKSSKNCNSFETMGLQKVYTEKYEIDADSKKSSAKRKSNENLQKAFPRQRGNNNKDASKNFSKIDDCVAGGLSDGGKKISGKSAKRTTNTPFELFDSDLQGSLHEEKVMSSEAHEVKKVRKNNVHLQRRILANARERSRVHKLGEAFRMLRNVIPSFSADQKLSKLSTLRIAVSYISALGSLLDLDIKPGAKQVFTSSVDQCTFALQSEFGRAKGTRKSKSKIDKSTKCKRAKSNK